MPTLIQLKSPRDCSKEKIDAFIRLAEEGGEVDPHGLPGRVARAAFLAFLHEENRLIGVGALKNQSPDYVKDVFASAGCEGAHLQFRWELGWVSVARDHWEKGHSKTIVGALLVPAQGAAIYATSNTGRIAMHRTLEKLGFIRRGGDWASKQHRGERLYLFVRQ
jgi:hypothetical protein